MNVCIGSMAQSIFLIVGQSKKLIFESYKKYDSFLFSLPLPFSLPPSLSPYFILFFKVFKGDYKYTHFIKIGVCAQEA